MAYQALYRKWRPSVFEDVVGQNHIVETLKNQINTNKIAHAYLFCGSRGTGKTSTAKIFSRAVNCENPVNGNPCNECDTCKGILNSSIFDVVEIDGASNNKVDDVRNIRDEVVHPPAYAKYKVYIIDEVHMLTTEAFNALLKTLEEPPKYVIFILATTEFHKIPATIISRCQKFDFKRITYRDTAKRIKEVAEKDNIKITDSAVKLLAKAADGSLRDGLSKLDQCLALGLLEIDYKDVVNIIGASDPQFLSDFCDAIIDEDLGHALKLLDDGVNMGIDALRLYTDVTDYFRDLLMIKTSKDYSLVVNTEEEILNKYEEQISKLTLPRILKIIETLFEGQSMAKYLASPKLSFETSLLKIASKTTDTAIETLLDRISALEEKLERISLGDISNVSDIKVTEPVNGEKEIEIIVQPEEAMEPEDVDEEEYVFSEEPDEEEFLFPIEEIAEPSKEQEKIEENTFIEDYEPVFEEEEIKDNFTEITSANENEIKDESTLLIETQSDEEVQNLILNFKEFVSQIKNKDMGFDMIVKSASLTAEGNTLVLEFENKTSYDIAKLNKYDEVISDAVKEIKEIDIFVKLKNKSQKSKMEEILKDPFDEIKEIAEQNQIIFNFEE